METTTHINKLSSALQRINISYCFAPELKKGNRGACCRAFLLSVLLSILQTIILTNKRRRIPYPRGDGGLSLFALRLILYQESKKRRKRRKVGLKSPPQKYEFSPGRTGRGHFVLLKCAEGRCV